MEKRSSFIVDLTKIEGEGEFPCPQCEEIISPDDESGGIYDVAGTRTSEDGSLVEVLVLCKKCGSRIHLRGFEALEETIENTGIEDTDDLSKGLSTYPPILKTSFSQK